MKKFLVISAVAVIVMLVSCKKDNSNNTKGIDGTYKFKSLSAKTNSTVIGSYGEKIITTADYTSTNNQGTLVFNNSTATGTGLTYTINTEAKSYMYDGPDLTDSSSYPFTFTMPATNSVSQYKLVGADSIYFPGGSVTSGMSTTGASGGRYTWNGNLLTISGIATRDTTYEDSGEMIQLHESSATSFVLEKQ